MSDVRRKRLFVSYTGVDAERASHIADVLRERGHEVTIQDADFLPGSNFVLEMQRAITDADHVIAVLSPEYEQSAFAAPEWAAAFASDPSSRDRRLIGIRVRDYTPTGLLRSIVYADLVAEPETAAFQRVFDSIELDDDVETPTAPVRSEGGGGNERRRATPPYRVPNFVGREAQLEAVGSALEGDNARVAITGLGGIGKSSLASEWVEMNIDRFDMLVWLYAPDEQRALEGLVNAASKAGLVASDVDADSAIAAVQGALAQAERPLIVLDDCPDSGIADDVLGGLQSRALVTSRADRGWSAAGFKQVRLEPWAVDEAATYLAVSAPDGGPVPETLCQVLGGLPIALAQAAAYVDVNAITFTAYLERLATHADQLLETSAVSPYELTVKTVWTLALDDLKQTQPAAAQIMELLAIMDSQDFPRVVLELGHDALPDPLASTASDPFELDSAIAHLLRQSLCRAAGDGLSVHPVVQGVVLGRLSDDERARTISVAIECLLRARPEHVSPDTWPTWDRLGSHIASAARAAIAFNVYTGDLRPLVTEFAGAMREKGFPHFANALHGEVLNYVNSHADVASPRDIVSAMHDYAISLVGLRAPADAVPILRRVVELDESMGFGRTARSIDSQVALASALTDSGHHDEALEVLVSASENFEDGELDDAQLGIALYGTWGRALVHAGRAGEGREQLLRALEIAEDADRSSDIALTHLQLGNAALAEGDLGLAQESYTRALASSDQLPADLHLRADALANLGSVAVARREWDHAMQFTEDAIATLNEVPEGLYSVTSGLLHYQRAQLRARLPAVDVRDVVSDAGFALEVLCDHLPPAHSHRVHVAEFLLWVAESIGDEAIKDEVLTREPSARPRRA